MCHRFITLFLCHSSLIPDCLVGSRPPYDLTGELGRIGPMAFGIWDGWKNMMYREASINTSLKKQKKTRCQDVYGGLMKDRGRKFQGSFANLGPQGGYGHTHCVIGGFRRPAMHGLN